MPTPYSDANGQFSNVAHLSAQTMLYPNIFGVNSDKLSFISTLLGDGGMSDVLDGVFGVDRIVKVQAAAAFIRQPLSFTVQERFRRQEYARYKDITITEWNVRTNQPSELYKLMANIFLYGYYSTDGNSFIDAIAFDVQMALRLLVRGDIEVGHGSNPRSGQTFITITFDALYRAGCVIYWHSLKSRKGLSHG
jgi:hypothetical protein